MASFDVCLHFSRQPSSSLRKNPESLVGKKVEVIAFEVSEEMEPISAREEDKERLKRLTEAVEGNRIDLSNFVVDRDQANNYV